MKVAVLTLFTAISLTTTALESQISLNQNIVLNILPSSLQIGDEIDISIDLPFNHFRYLVHKIHQKRIAWLDFLNLVQSVGIESCYIIFESSSLIADNCFEDTGWFSLVVDHLL